MKRLIKKASVNTGDFINKWITQPNTRQQLYETVIYVMNENPDCIYSGEAYKFFEISTRDITSAYYPLLKNKASVKRNKFIKAITSLIVPDDRYSSWAKTYEGMVEYCNESGSHVGVVIKANVFGLDLGELFYKYTDQIEQLPEYQNSNNLVQFGDSLVEQEEIIAPMITAWELVDVNGVRIADLPERLSYEYLMQNRLFE